MLRAGTGEAPIHFPAEAFPNPRERYTGVHDDPLAHALILESGETFCFVFLDIVDPGDWEMLRRCAAAELSIPADHVLIHISHVLSTPHCTKPDEIPDETERTRDALHRQVIKDAVTEAVREAEKCVIPVRAGVGYAVCGLNASRVLATRDGYSQGICETGRTDNRVPVICLEDAEGRPRTVLYTVNTTPAVLEGSRLADGSRPVSGDIASGSARFLEELTGAKAVYTSGATADQWPVLRAVWEHRNAEGELVTEDYGEQGFLMVELLSRRLAQAVAQALPRIECGETDGEVRLRKITLSLPGHRRLAPPEMRNLGPVLNFTREADVETDVYILTLGDTAVVGCEPELCVETVEAIRAGSPYRHTIVVEFVNGLADYMAAEDLYEKAAPQAKKGCFMPGAAEQFVREVVAELKRSAD